MKHFSSWLSIIMMTMMLLMAISQGQATVVWTEDFTSLEDWDLYEWDPTIEEYWTVPRTPQFSIEDGALTTPNDQEFVARYAVHDSIVTSGSWSFDWEIDSRPGHDSAAFIAFMFTDPIYQYNITTVSSADDYYQGTTGYGIALFSSSKFQGYAGKYAAPGITLLNMNDFKEMRRYYFDENVTGGHDIKITRDDAGSIEVYFDQQQVIQASNRDASIESEKFLIWPFIGDGKFDNITVSDLEVPTVANQSTESETTDLSALSLGLGIIILGVVTILTKRKY